MEIVALVAYLNSHSLFDIDYLERGQAHRLCYSKYRNSWNCPHPPTEEAVPAADCSSYKCRAHQVEYNIAGSPNGHDPSGLVMNMLHA